MVRLISVLLLALCWGAWAAAQVDQLPPDPNGPAPSQAPPRYEHEAGVSSSHDTKIDLSPPKDDAKDHPKSTSAVADAEDTAASDVQEMHPWNPHKAAKDIEIGDFYFKRKNYHAALDRYREALEYKPDDALANYRMGECFAKLDNPDEAVTHYQAYLKILPQGPLSGDAHKALEKLQAEKTQASRTDQPKEDQSEQDQSKPDQPKQ